MKNDGSYMYSSKSESSQETTNLSKVKEIKNITSRSNSTDEVYKRAENFSVPVNIRRNSFLENMLSEEAGEILKIPKCVIDHRCSS